MLRPLNSVESGLQGRRALVTGAGGFIGSHLTERLLHLGCQVRALVRYNSRNHVGYLTHLSHPALEIVAGDICDAQFSRDLVKGCQDVYHLAALIGIPYSYVAPQNYIAVNVGGTGNLLAAAQDTGVERFLQTSTSEVYGSAQCEPMDERHPLHPQSPYAATKVGADQLALSYHLSFGLPVTVIRPFNTYGPRQSLRAVLPTICSQALSGSQIRLGSTDTYRDLTYVEDTCAGFTMAAASSRTVGETVNLGFGQTIQIGALVQTVSQALNKPLSVIEEDQRKRPAGSEVNRLISDNRKAADLMDWRPLIPLTDGVGEFLNWLRQNQPDRVNQYVR